MGLSFAVLTAAALIATTRASSHSFSKRNSTIDWFSCGDLDSSYNAYNLTNVVCGFFEVPLDWADESVGTAKLAVAKFPATKERRGTVFGGPGESGVGFIFEYGPNVSATIGGHYDLVSWDTRGGRGHSDPKPPACFNTSDELAQFFAGTLEATGLDIKGKLTDDGQVDEFYSHVDEMEAKYRALGQRCAEAESGRILPYIGTAATVRDMVAMADYLDPGVQEINYWGFSYGSLLGMTFVNMFPDRVGHAILDGCVDPILYYDKPTPEHYANNLNTTDAAFAGFTDGCVKAGKDGCQLGFLDQAHDLVEAGADMSQTLTSAEFRGQILSALYSPTNWGKFAALAASYGQSLQSLSTNATVPADLASQLAPLKRNASTTYEGPAIWCGDGVDAGNMTMRDGFDAIVQASENVSSFFGPKWWDIPGVLCFAWPARAVERFTGPWYNKLKNRVLVIGNTADPVTPFKNAQLMADLLGESAVLIRQDGFGHASVAEKSTCTANVVGKYFEDGSLPEDNDTVCEIDDSVVLFPTSGASQ
ncbi:TAP-like protein-domain-containing protein [Schizophyllum commune]